MKKIFVIVSVIVIALTGCGADDYTYSSYPCYLVIHNEIHKDPTLASSMIVTSPGVFCLITTDKAKKTYTFKTNQGLSSTIRYNAVDEQLTKNLGMNNGLIVGYGTLSQRFQAFDHECPNCYNPESIPIKDRPLTMTNQGFAYCPVCKDTFDMNNNGICTNNQGRLTQYRCGSTDPMGYGVLSVGN